MVDDITKLRQEIKQGEKDFLKESKKESSVTHFDTTSRDCNKTEKIDSCAIKEKTDNIVTEDPDRCSTEENISKHCKRKVKRNKKRIKDLTSTYESNSSYSAFDGIPFAQMIIGAVGLGVVLLVGFMVFTQVNEALITSEIIDSSIKVITEDITESIPDENIEEHQEDIQKQPMEISPEETIEETIPDGNTDPQFTVTELENNESLQEFDPLFNTLFDRFGSFIPMLIGMFLIFNVFKIFSFSGRY